jgi:folate-dependent phosphoribosylglycinamide formyltransferase PurN
MQKIGILAEKGAKIFDWQLTRKALLQAEVELTFFVEIPSNRPRRYLRHLPARVLWKVICTVEGLRFGKMANFEPPLDATMLNCEFQGFRKTFSNEALEAVRRSGVDLILRLGGQGIYSGSVLEAAPLGIISIHHGDNRTFRGGPPGFWEVLNDAPTVGFIVQQLTPKLDGGHVLARGNVTTSRFATENRSRLFAEADRELAQVLNRIAKTGRLPDPETCDQLGPIYRLPGMLDLVRYLKKSWLRRSLDIGAEMT